MEIFIFSYLFCVVLNFTDSDTDKIGTLVFPEARVKNTFSSFLLLTGTLLVSCDLSPDFKTSTRVPVDKNSKKAGAEGVQGSQGTATNTTAGIEGTSENQTANTTTGSNSGGNSPGNNTSSGGTSGCENPALVKSDVVKVTIPKNIPDVDGGLRCPFGKNDNNNEAGGLYSARIERKFDINIPAGRVVCSMKAGSQQQTIEYDDHLFLTLNNHVLISSRGIPTSSFQKATNGFYLYDWSKIRGTKNSSSLLCADGTTCQIPKTQTTGAFAFEMSEAANKAIFSSLANQPLFFTMVLTGDDNPPIDCAQHMDIIMDVSYTYIQK
jgi:hypothetical protein